MRYHFPAHNVCPYCASLGATPVELSPRGHLWAYTSVTAAPPGYVGKVPFGFGIVELPEGLRVITRLTEADPSQLSVGEAVALQIVPLHTDDSGNQVVTFAFGPTGSSAEGST